MLTEEELMVKYPEWAARMETYYPAYTWEAFEVPVTGGFTKTLFRITGSSAAPDFKAKKQPVLLVAGGTNNSLTWISTPSMSELGKSKKVYAG